MPKAARLPATACGEKLRRLIEARRERARRVRIAIACALGVMPCAATLVAAAPPRLVWNASASLPKGLYRVSAGAQLRRGDSVIASLREPFRSLAARRGYLPSGVPLVKRIAAVPGDRVCARGTAVSIGGKPAMFRQAVDGRGRPLPRWSGCLRLKRGEYLLLGEGPWSFDGRYFGPSDATQIIGRAVLLWPA